MKLIAEPPKILKTITLPSGRTATIREARGSNMVEVYEEIGQGKTPAEFFFGLAARISKIDDEAVCYLDLLDMPLADASLLVNEAIEASPSIPEPPPSQG